MVIERIQKGQKEVKTTAKRDVIKEVNSNFEERLASLKAGMLNEMDLKVEKNLKRDLKALAKKTNMLIDLQRQKFREMQDKIVKTNVKVEAFNQYINSREVA